MTESSPVTLLTPCTRPKSKLSSCGQLIPGTEAKVMGLKDGKPQPVNGQGELWVRGPQVSVGSNNRIVVKYGKLVVSLAVS